MFKRFVIDSFCLVIAGIIGGGNVVDRVGMLLADHPAGGKMSDGGMAGNVLTKESAETETET